MQDVHHSVHDFEVVDEVGETVSLSDYEGKVVLVVNIGSRCTLPCSPPSSVRAILGMLDVMPGAACWTGALSHK